MKVSKSFKRNRRHFVTKNIKKPYNSGVSSNTDTGAGTMRHGTLAVGVKLLVQVTEEEPGAERGVPSVGVHLEVVEVLEINHETVAIATKTEVAVMIS